jgi:hypothetical protein
MAESADGLKELKSAVADLHQAISLVRDQRGTWQLPQTQTLPVQSADWNFTTFEKFINQRFADLSLQLRERYEAQQTGVTAALAAAEKAVNAALIAAEKAVDKAEGAQQLRNEAQNEFRKSLSDLSALMWTIKEGTAAIESTRREAKTETEALRREYLVGHQTVLDRIGILESGSSNIQGRIWAISAVWAVLSLAVTLGSRFIGH